MALICNSSRLVSFRSRRLPAVRIASSKTVVPCDSPSKANVKSCNVRFLLEDVNDQRKQQKKMSTPTSKKQKIKELKQVVPLQMSKDAAEPPAQEVVEDGIRLFKRESNDGKVSFPTLFLHRHQNTFLSVV